MPITLRQAGPDDWLIYRNLRLRALTEEPQAYASPLERELQLTDQQWRERLGRAFTVLALTDEELIGTATGVWRGDGDMMIVAMYVVPEARGRGLAVRLIDVIAGAAMAGGGAAGSCLISPREMPLPSAAIAGTDSFPRDRARQWSGIPRSWRAGSPTRWGIRQGHHDQVLPALSAAEIRVTFVPSATSSMSDPDALLDRLDPEQREVATSLGGPVAVIAGAGTGKTRAITHRIAYGVRTGAYNPSSVLAVTFTTRAAGELRGRLQQLGAYGVQARTFHSAALRQAQYFWPRIHGGELPRVVDNRMPLVAEAASRLKVSVDTPKLRDLVGEISWAKVCNVSAEEYPSLAAQHNRVLASLDPETIARIFAGYEAAKRDRSRIDFEDILLCTAALIAGHAEVADAIRRTYRHLVVDEYQDVSPLQEALLNLWRGDRQDICVVGDPAQTIHSFAGADAGFLTDFRRRYRSATVIRLMRDYRSTPQVVACANGVMTQGGQGGLRAVTLKAQRPPGPEPIFAEAPDEASEAAAIADWLATLASSDVEYRDMSVLFRINAQSPAIEQALAERGIPYLVRGGERFYQRPEVRQALLALRTELRATESDTVTPVNGVERVKAVLATLGWAPEPPAGAGAVRERWESLAALLSVADDLADAAGGSVDLAAIVAELEGRAEAQHVPSAQGVTVATLHSAKGLEWEAVALLGMHDGSLPFVLATTPDQIAEERRLLYVGLTRARHHLRISWSRTRNGGGNARKPSRFLDPVLPASVLSSASKLRGRSRGSLLAAHCRSCGRALNHSAERKLGRHTDCPSTFDERTLTLLKEWRRQEAAAQDMPAYCVFTDATLVALAEARPANSEELIKVTGVGPTKAQKYGDHVLAILAQESSPAVK